MDGRMTVCNMSIEGGARAGMIAPDDTTFAYLEGRPYVPRGKDFQEAVEAWKALATDPGAKFDATVELDASALAPQVTWGTNPGMVTGVTGRVPDPGSFRDPDDQKAAARALAYMDLKPGTALVDVPVDRVFIGSCTNSRINDLRAAARVVAGKHISKNLKGALVVPGSMAIKAKAEAEGLDKIFLRRRIRMARCGMQHVPRHESGHPACPESAPPALRTGISKAARARTAGRTWSARSWPRRRRLPAILWMSAIGTWKRRSSARFSLWGFALRTAEMPTS